MFVPQGYSLAAYGSMIMDRVRTDAYAEALRRAVTPDSVVLDIGAGPGIMSLLACKFGARRVFAVDPDSSIHIARELAAANGFADRITFIQDITANLELPEPATIMVSDIHGALPLFQRHIPTVVDARTRLLAPGGTLIPQRDTIYAAVVEDNSARRALLGAWQDSPYELNMEAALGYAVNIWMRDDVPRDILLGAEGVLVVLDYRTIHSPDVRASITLPVERAGGGHGFLLWYDVELLDGIGYSNAPPRSNSISGQSFFPWPKAVPLAAGDEVTVTVEAKLVRDAYVWRWRTEIRPHSGAQAIHFDQSSFFGAPLNARQLQQRMAESVPVLSAEGELDRSILSLCDGKRTLTEIAAEVSRLDPLQFADAADALARAADVTARYARHNGMLAGLEHSGRPDASIETSG